MNKLLTAIALTIAPPAVAQAATQAPAASGDCCDKIKAAGRDMAKIDHDMGDMTAGTTMPAGHDMHHAALSPRPIPSIAIT